MAPDKEISEFCWFWQSTPKALTRIPYLCWSKIDSVAPNVQLKEIIGIASASETFS